MGRNLFSRAKEEEQLLAKLKARLSQEGSMHFAESVPSLGSRLSDFVAEDLRLLLCKAESRLYGDPANPLTNWTAKDLLELFEQAGFATTSLEMDLQESRSMSEDDIRRYITASYLPSFAAQAVEVDAKKLEQELIAQLSGRSLAWKHHLLIVHAFAKALPKQQTGKDDGTFSKVKKKVHSTK